MAYTSAAKVKIHLWITDTSFDTILSELVADADVEINSILDIDGFWSGTKEDEVVSFRNVYVYSGGYYRFLLKNLNVQTITEINGSSYTWTKWVGEDYYIKHSRAVYLDDLYNYVNDTSFDMFTITYTYWRSAIPDDVKLLAKLWVARRFREMYPMYAVNSTQLPGVTSYQLADERIQFKANQQEREDAQIKKILSKYKKVHVF